MQITTNIPITLYVVSAMYDMYDAESYDDVEVFTDYNQAFDYMEKTAIEFAATHEVSTAPHQWGDNDEQTQFPTFNKSAYIMRDRLMVEDNCANRLFLTMRAKTL